MEKQTNQDLMLRKSTSFLREIKECIVLSDEYIQSNKRITLSDFGVHNPDDFDPETFSIGSYGYELAGDEEADAYWFRKYQKEFKANLNRDKYEDNKSKTGVHGRLSKVTGRSG